VFELVEGGQGPRGSAMGGGTRREDRRREGGMIGWKVKE
jgi:hypothetical protein